MQRVLAVPPVVGVNLPTFVERPRGMRGAARSCPVVGVNLPTFVERHGMSRKGLPAKQLSSGLTSRPSLSAKPPAPPRMEQGPVVGVNLPTFVERPTLCRAARTRSPVVGVNLPTFVERAVAVSVRWRQIVLSSGLTSRPSLSDPPRRIPRRPGAAVVGVNLPTFVERRPTRDVSQKDKAAVVGVNLPTFVERARRARTAKGSRSVVGVNLPTFVEREIAGAPASPCCRCRRG